MMFVLWPEVAISYIMGSVCKPIILSVIKGKKENVLDVKAMEEQRGVSAMGKIIFQNLTSR
jgi:hypothetical protein